MSLLQGRLILDCSTHLPGPFLGKLLVKQGARVIKVEHPTKPDPGIAMAGGAFYRDLNERKEIARLDLLNETDQKRFESLVRQADGLIEGFRPEAKRKLGLDAESLHRINPKLCIASLIGYAEDGPWRDRAGHNLNFEAVTGVLSLFTEMPALPLADLFAAYEGALALAAMLDGVARGAPGGRVAISMAGALAEAQSGLWRTFLEAREEPRPGTTLFSGVYPCYRLYRAGCGRRVAVGALESKFWATFCDLIGAPECRPHAYARGELGQQTIHQVQAKLATRPWSEWAPLFAGADCCVEAERTYAEVLADGPYPKS